MVGWLVCVIIWLTWAPFAGRPASATEALANPPGILDFVGNLLLFMPVALVATVAVQRGTLRSWSMRVGAVAFASSVVIEAGQHFMAGRFVSARDVALNTAGAVVMAACIGALRARGHRVRRLVAPTAVLVFLGVTGYMGANSVFVARTFRLEEWDPSFPVVSADEAGGDRPYAGEVIDARLCVEAGVQEQCVAAGAEAQARRRLAEAAVREQRVTLRATVISWRNDQAGPARILTFSGGTGERNATLAQDGRTLVARLRTPLSGPNGSRIEFGLPDAVQANDTVRARASFERGILTLGADGATRRDATFRFGILDSWILARSIERILPAHLLRARITGAIVLGLPLLLFAVGVGHWWTRRTGRGAEVPPVEPMP